MAIAEIQKQTNANIQEKANLIWEIATHLVGFYNLPDKAQNHIIPGPRPLCGTVCPGLCCP